MNLTKHTLLVITVATLLISSCKKSNDVDTPAPMINDFELGLSNSGQAYAGQDVHIEGELSTADKLGNIRVKIVQKTSVTYTGKWNKDTTYTKFVGQKNALFHEHIVLPAGTPLGKYDFTFSVSDSKGKITEIKRELDLLALTDFTPPTVSVTTVPTNGQVFAKGQTINIKGTVTEDKGIGAVYVALIPEDQPVADNQINGGNTIGLYLAYDLKPGTLTKDFDASIAAGAAKDIQKDITGNLAWKTGRYYLVVVATSAYGSERTYSAHYPIQINL